MTSKFFFMFVCVVLAAILPSTACAAQVNLQLSPILSSWETNASINPFGDFGTSPSFSTLVYGGVTYLIVTEQGGGQTSYNWDGDSWEPNILVTNLPLASTDTTCLYTVGGAIYAINSGNSGVWNGYYYNFDGTWTSIPSIVAGLNGVATYGANVDHQVAIINGVPTMFIGDRAGNRLRARYWNGAAWDTSPYETTLPTGITRGAPTVLTYYDELYLVYGQNDGTLGARKWTGSEWASSATFVAPTTDFGSQSTPTIFQLGTDVYILGGIDTGTTFGLRNVNHRWRMINDGGTFNAAVPPIQHPTSFTVTDLTNLYHPTYTYAIYYDSSLTNFVTSGNGTGVQTTQLVAGKYYWFITATSLNTGSVITSDLYSFTIAETSANSGIGVHGMVYDIETFEALSGAVVRVSNATWESPPFVTSSTGVFDISVPVAGTYTVTASKTAYDTGAATATVGTGFVVQNVPLVKSQSYFAPIDVSFKVVEHWYSINGIPDAVYTVYKGADILPLKTGVTDNTGNFVLEDIEAGAKYRIVISVNGGTMTEDVYVYPGVSSYRIIFEASTSYLPANQFYSIVNVTVSQSLSGSSNGIINVTYSDSQNATSAVYFQVGQTASNGTFVPLSTSPTNAGNMSHSFLLTNVKGEDYIVKLVVTHGSFGSITKEYLVQFPGNTLPYSDSKIWTYLAVGILLVVGMQFGSADAHKGAVVLCGLGFFLWYVDMFAGMGTTANSTIAVGLGLATCYSLLALFNKKQKESGL